MLPLEQIFKNKFEKAIFGGYDTAQVDSFVETAVSEYNKLQNENQELNDKLQVVLDRVVEYQKDEAALHNALLTAQRVANEITSEAKKKASAIIGEAEKTRSEVMEAAKRITEVKRQEYLRDLSTDVIKLENCRKVTEEFVKKIVRSYQVQIERLQSIASIELDRTSLYVAASEAEQNDIVGDFLKDSIDQDYDDEPELPADDEIEETSGTTPEAEFADVPEPCFEASVAAMAMAEPAQTEESEPESDDDVTKEIEEALELAFVQAGRESPAGTPEETSDKERDIIAARSYERRLNIKRESETVENGMHTRIVEVTLADPEKEEPAKKKGFHFGHEVPEEDTIPNRPSFNFEGLQFGDDYDPKK